MRRIFVLLFILSSLLMAQDIVIQFHEAEYQEGVVSTNKGGVIVHDCMRIQAQNICYKHQETVQAEGNLLVLYGKKIMAGKRFEYNFITQCGTIYDGILTEFPCVIGAKKIHIKEDGSYLLEDSYITLCETNAQDFSVNSGKIKILKK